MLAIDSQAVEDFWDKIKNKYSQDELKDIERYFFKPGGNFFIGLENNRIIGMCGYIPIDSTTVELKRLRVEKSLRSQGYGTQLLRFTEKDILSKDYKKIIFSTASVREATLKFYSKHSYKKTGTSKYDELITIEFEKWLTHGENHSDERGGNRYYKWSK